MYAHCLIVDAKLWEGSLRVLKVTTNEKTLFQNCFPKCFSINWLCAHATFVADKNFISLMQKFLNFFQKHFASAVHVVLEISIWGGSFINLFYLFSISSNRIMTMMKTLFCKKFWLSQCKTDKLPLIMIWFSTPVCKEVSVR